MIKYYLMKQILVKKKRKIEEILELKEKALFYFFINLNKFPAKTLNELRRKIKQNGGILKVYKKSLLLKSGALNEDFKSESPFGIVFIFEDNSKILNIINQIQNEKNIGEYIFGYFQNKKYPANFWKMIGEIPSKEFLILKLTSIFKNLILRFILSLKIPLNNFLKLLILKNSKANSS